VRVKELMQSEVKSGHKAILYNRNRNITETVQDEGLVFITRGVVCVCRFKQKAFYDEVTHNHV